jgi:PTS system nitrogen regulatory IIA component
VRNPVVLPVKSAQVALGFLKKPVDFSAVDGKPVFAFFALLAPTVRTHMHLLARLACVLREESVRRAVERQATSQEILDAVRAAERKLGSAQEGGAARAPSPE